MRKSNKGFTLVELIVVIAVIAILAVLAAVAFMNVRDNAETAAVNAEANRIVAYIDLAESVGPTGVNRSTIIAVIQNGGTHSFTVPGEDGQSSMVFSITTDNHARIGSVITAVQTQRP